MLDCGGMTFARVVVAVTVKQRAGVVPGDQRTSLQWADWGATSTEGAQQLVPPVSRSLMHVELKLGQHSPLQYPLVPVGPA
jgi:hypothetical protein